MRPEPNTARMFGITCRILGALLIILISRETGARDRPNVLLIVADDLRADALSAYGNAAIKTPHIDQLARRGQLFRSAIANNPICVPSRAEMLTGCSALRNGVFPGYSDELDESLITWPKAMRRSGYQTVAIGKWHIAGRPSERGFEELDALFAESSQPVGLVHSVDSYGREVTGYRNWVLQSDDGQRAKQGGAGLTPDINREFADAAIRKINKSQDRPLFVQVNFTAPHDPLLWPTNFRELIQPAQVQLPVNFKPRHPFDNGSLDNRDERLLPTPRTETDIRRELAIYLAVIAHLDEQVGRIIAALEESGLADNTLVIFTSDHGVAKGSHGLIGKQNLYEHTIKVPLIVAGLDLPSGQTRLAQVQLRDLFPTVCELAGVPVPASVEGASFASVLRGDDRPVHDALFGYITDSQRMIRTDRYKLIAYPQAGREQLFDLQSDPSELSDLSAKPVFQDELQDLRQRLRAWQEAESDPLLARDDHDRARPLNRQR